MQDNTNVRPEETYFVQGLFLQVLNKPKGGEDFSLTDHHVRPFLLS